MKATALGPDDLATVRAYLSKLEPHAPVSALLARQLLATIDETAAREDAAWALLMTDLTPTTPDQGHH